MRCEVCGKDVLMPFKCRYCGGYFCAEHRLPEKHDCPGLFAAASPYEKELKEVRAAIRREEELRTMELRRRARGEAAHLAAGTLLVILVGFSLIGYRLSLPVWLLAVLVGGFAASFLLHEFAHRWAANRYGLPARFRLDPMGSILTLITAIPFIPFKIIAPGAVVVSGLLTTSMLGWISLAGPLTNIVLSAALLNAEALAARFGAVALAYALGSLASLNAFIAFFNLLPFGPFDGLKVMAWSKSKWLLATVASIALLILSYYM